MNLIFKSGILIFLKLFTTLLVSYETNSDFLFIVISYISLVSFLRLGSISRFIELFNSSSLNKKDIFEKIKFDFRLDLFLKILVWLIFFQSQDLNSIAITIVLFRSFSEYSKVFFIVDKKEKLYSYFDLVLEFLLVVIILLKVNFIWIIILIYSLLINYKKLFGHIKFKLMDMRYFKIDSLSSLIYGSDNIILSFLNLPTGFITNYNLVFRFLTIPEKVLNFSTHLTKSKIFDNKYFTKTNNISFVFSLVILVIIFIVNFLIIKNVDFANIFFFIIFEKLNSNLLLLSLLTFFFFSQLVNRYLKNNLTRNANLFKLLYYNYFFVSFFIVLSLISVYYNSWLIFIINKILISLLTLIVMKKLITNE